VVTVSGCKIPRQFRDNSQIRVDACPSQVYCIYEFARTYLRGKSLRPYLLVLFWCAEGAVPWGCHVLRGQPPGDLSSSRRRRGEGEGSEPEDPPMEGCRRQGAAGSRQRNPDERLLRNESMRAKFYTHPVVPHPRWQCRTAAVTRGGRGGGQEPQHSGGRMEHEYNHRSNERDETPGTRDSRRLRRRTAAHRATAHPHGEGLEGNIP
jgi:hypothetical protein